MSASEILLCGDIEKLIKNERKSDDEPVLYYVAIEDTYDVIKRAHIATGHGGRDRMIKETAKKYANITREALELFKSYCEECQKKRKRPVTKGPPHQILSCVRYRRNVQQKWRIISLTYFSCLELRTYYSDNEFAAEVISELKIIWPKLVLVHGKPQHPRSQGSVERANGDIKDMLVAWMGDIGIKFVQFQKNSGIRRSPYAAMFGCEAKVGLTSSSLPDEVIQRMQCEDDLLAVLTTGQNGEEPGPVPSAESAEVHFDMERPSPPSVVPNTLVPVRLVSAEVHVDTEHGIILQ
ncbi:KRAB-A domain-containing protein 2-like [Penaeus monodon]|uniref:KRAB-A domain-containing protein 2-like n=1 Tax=Penaeus monodon TaxID=6687 RepID=UPI0018A6EAE5|nr:KRAB-A domain-containing protein 2-like [Penaeus monodon]